MLPNFIGIGAPKAGTTWLFRCLQEHPQVFVAAVKETDFFDYHTIEGRMAEYEAHFLGSEGFMAVGEISTRYLASHHAPARIKEYIPEVRLFVSLRNPVEQVYSHYWHLLRQNFHQWDRTKVPRSFEEALEKYSEKLLEPAFYYKHLQRWLQYFDRSQLHIIFYDDIRTQPLQVLSSLYAFLEVDGTFTPQSINETGSSVRRGRAPKSSTLGRVHSFLHDQLNRNVYYPLKQLVGVKTAIQIKETLKIREVMEYLFFRNGYPEMRPDTRAWLREHFAEDIQKLEALTERDLGHWQ